MEGKVVSDVEETEESWWGKKSSVWAFVPFLMITTMVVLFREEHLKAFYKIFTNKFFLMNFGIVILFSTIILLQPDMDDDQTNTENQRLKMAVKHGIIAAMIAIFAALDLKLAPFWLIFMTSYYLDME